MSPLKQLFTVLSKFEKGLIVYFCVSRVNDWLLKINDIDLANKDRKQVVKAVLNGGGLINMVVRRRKSLGGRLVTPVHINLMGHKGMHCCEVLKDNILKSNVVA